VNKKLNHEGTKNTKEKLKHQAHQDGGKSGSVLVSNTIVLSHQALLDAENKKSDSIKIPL
jgi:hypothetical protein